MRAGKSARAVLLACALALIPGGALAAGAPKPHRPAAKPKPPAGPAAGALSCPDPDVTAPSPAVAPYRYYLVCTSDHDRNAFPIRGSNDLKSWHFIAHLFPDGHWPWWSLAPPHGKFWAPSIYRIQNRWVIYFAAVLDQDRINLPGPAGAYALSGGEMAIGVATATRLTGPWTTKVLHWRGQFNDVDPEQETYGGVIDASTAVDPRTGQRYLFWAEQHYSIWVGKLSADGLTLDPGIHQALQARTAGWECSGTFCVVEGPTAFFRNGLCYLLYSGASTWNSTYAVGAAVAADPMQGSFARLASAPILSSGRVWVGPGGTSDPVIDPAGRVEILYHASVGPNSRHISARRYLRMAPLRWGGVQDAYPGIGGGTAQ
jgi:GH43 family beta-xylosidase